MVQSFNYGIMIVARRLYLNPSLKGNDCTTIERDAILVRGEQFGRDKGFAGVEDSYWVAALASRSMYGFDTSNKRAESVRKEVEWKNVLECLWYSSFGYEKQESG